MDIALYSAALRRHRTIVLVGVALTLALTVLSYVRISPSGIGYRSEAIWSNQATLVLTQAGAPELRSVLPPGPAGSGPALADTGRFTGLIDVYATLATSDAVVQELLKRGLVEADDLKDGALPLAAAPAPSAVNASTPLMTLTATSTSAEQATELTLAATTIFLNVVQKRQLEAGIPEKDRIQLRVVKSAEAPRLIKPRSKALTMMVFLAGLIATAGVALTRDNLARRDRVPELTTVGSVDEPAEQESSLATSRARSTLGSVPGPDSATPLEHETSGEVARRWSRGG